MLRSNRMQMGDGDMFEGMLRDPGKKEATKEAKFYFQQRRGRIDIRSISQLDVDRIVRDVDIDLLQTHLENLTFCELKESDLRYLTDPQIIKLFQTSQMMIEYLLFVQEQLTTNLQQLADKYVLKKRSLTKKRIELVSLQESTKHLREEVRVKKNSVIALEDLLKTAHQQSHEKRRKQQRTTTSSSSTEIPQSSSDMMSGGIRQPVIRFFVTGPDGLCVEFNEKRTSSILHLKHEIRKAFVPRLEIIKYRRIHGDLDGPSVRLIYQGRILTDDGTVDSNDIREGDTIVAIIDRSEDDDDDEVRIHTHSEENKQGNTGVSESKHPSTDVGKLLLQQQETMQQVAWEMKRGLDVAMQVMQQPPQPSSSGKGNKERGITGYPGSRMGDMGNAEGNDVDLVDRWNQFEQSMWQQLDTKMEQYQERIAVDVGKGLHHHVTSTSGLEIGDLESDGEEHRIRPPRLRSTEATEGMDDRAVNAIDKLNDSVEELTEVIRAANHPLDNRNKHVRIVTTSVDSTPGNFNQSSSSSGGNVDSDMNSQMPMVVNAKNTTTRSISVSSASSPGQGPASGEQQEDGIGPEMSKLATKWEDKNEKHHGQGVASETARGQGLDSSKDLSGLSGLPDDIEEIVMNDDAVGSRPPSHGKNISEDEEAEDDADALLAEMIEDDTKVTTRKDGTTTNSSDMSTNVSVVFPFIFMDSVVAALATTSGERDWTITLSKQLDTEDVILELRRGVSDKADVSFKSVSLLLYDKSITFAMDLPTDEMDSFDAEKAKELAAEGSLGIKISTQTESSKQPSSSSSSNKKLNPPQMSGSRRADDEIILNRRPPSSSSSNTLPPRHGSKDMDDDHVWGATAEEQQLRKSLDLTLQELSDKEGLSDVELNEKLQTLRRSTSASPTNDLFSYHKTVAEAVDAAMIESPRPPVEDRPALLQLSGDEKIKLKQQLSDGTRGLRESRDSTVDSSIDGGMGVRLSLPNGGRGRRSIDASLDTGGDEDFKMFGSSAIMNQSAISIRGYDEDSVPMMQSLSSFPTPLVRHDNEDTLMDDDEDERSRKKDSHFDDEDDDEESSPTITRGDPSRGDPLRSYMNDRMKDQDSKKGSDQRARESVDSLAGRIEAKQERISFDEETTNTSVAAIPTEISTTDEINKNNDNNKKGSNSGYDNKTSSSSTNNRVGNIVTDDRSMYSSSHVDDDSLGGEGIGARTGADTGTGTLSFAISDNASEYNDHNHSIATGGLGMLSYPGTSTAASVSASHDFGITAKTMSSLGASGSISGVKKMDSGVAATSVPPVVRSGVGSLGARVIGEGMKSSTALGGDQIDHMGNTGGTNTSDVSQFDYMDNTLDSEGDMLRGGVSMVNPSQIKTAADVYEGNKPSGNSPPDQKKPDEAETKAVSKDWLPLNLLKSPPTKTRPDVAAGVTVTSPTSHGSSFTNSGLFDNLTDHEHDAARADIDHSLALSDSAGYIDNDSKL